MPRSFLLLELLDPQVTAFLWAIRRTLSGTTDKGPIHVTLRGPYEGEPPKQVMERAEAALRPDVLKIAGVGRFRNHDEEVVFLAVHSSGLRSVWWKPSYPIERFGFTPHISLYRGPDSNLADAIADFLSLEKIELNCAEYRLVWHQSGQPNLFSHSVPTIGALRDLTESTRIDATMLDRLEAFVDKYRSEQSTYRLSRR